MRKGWFRIPGQQDGDRALADQLKGLDRAFAIAPGASLLDLGCAEGLIALAFADRGAAPVTAIECNAESLAVARSQSGAERVRFVEGNLNDILARGALEPHDVVLALAILHKMRDPAAATRHVAALARTHLVVRLPGGSVGEFGSKWTDRRVDTRVVLSSCGLRLIGDEPGPNGERVHYWERVA